MHVEDLAAKLALVFYHHLHCGCFCLEVGSQATNVRYLAFRVRQNQCAGEAFYTLEGQRSLVL